MERRVAETKVPWRFGREFNSALPPRSSERAGPRRSGGGLHVVVEPEQIARVVLRLDLL